MEKEKFDKMMKDFHSNLRRMRYKNIAKDWFWALIPFPLIFLFLYFVTNGFMNKG